MTDNDGVLLIPELPEGRRLTMTLISNWGDPTFIGLNSIEIFTDQGSRAHVEKIFTNAKESTGKIESLVDDHSTTLKNAEKMWCANMLRQNGDDEFGAIEPEPIKIIIELSTMSKIAMIRFWNYNASRVRAQIGVRHVEVTLDQTPIFRGEIDCAFSSDAEQEPEMGDTVLFTTDDKILELIAEHDVCLVPDHFSIKHQHFDVTSTSETLTPYRPTTCETKEIPSSPINDIKEPPKFLKKPKNFAKNDVKMIHIELIANWGLSGLIGLTGIEIVDEMNRAIDASEMTINTSSPTNPEISRRLINGINLTRDPKEMWLVDFDEKSPVTITIHLQKSITLKAISIWNYNESFELSYAGAKIVNIYVNGKMVKNCLLLRKAIGFVYFDYVQDILIDNLSTGSSTPSPPRQRPLTQSIGGFVFQLRLLSTWGDEFYIGLNGIELFNGKNELIKVQEHNLAAFPESVNILPSIQNDLRRSANLVDGINDTNEARHMWLTPLLPNRCARIFFVYDQPVYITKMIIYNYRKTPERGVRHFSLSVDDLIIFSGEVPMSSMNKTANLEINLREL